MIVGIDLGTTNSLAAVWQDGRPVLIPNGLGDVLTPSAISVDEDGAILVGAAARERLLTHPTRTAAAFKRAMGTDHDFKLGSKHFRAEELSALVLRALKQDAERYLGEPVTEAVVTVPAYFNEPQRRATKTAASMAGLRVERLLNEPTAAALAYGVHQSGIGDARTMVLDLGGGTFDVSILDMFEGVMEVRASAGDNFLGGEDFTALIMDAFIDAVGKKAGLPPRQHDKPEHAPLRRAAEIAKRALTDQEAHEIAIVHRGRDLRWTITRDRFEELCEPLARRIRAPIERALRDAKIDPSHIAHLVMAGGATRMPVFRRLMARLFHRLPITPINPDEVVAHGAAVQAGLKMRDAALDDVVMTDVAPFSLGIEAASTRGDTVVATGLFAPIIERNTVIPVSRSTVMSTVSDNQSVMALRVYQGEGRLVADNVLLGEQEVLLPLHRPRGQQIEIRFTYDTSGLLEVESRVLSNGQTSRLVLQGHAGAMTEAEIAARLAALAELKVHPRDQEENRAVLARVERLYAERLGDERRDIADKIDQFRFLINKQDLAAVASFRQQLVGWLDRVDRSYFA
jgi:molecular chaperone HscC